MNISSESRLRAGIAGVGHIGRFHVRHLSNHDHWRCMGLMDADGVRSQEISQEFGVPVHESLDSLLPEVDALFITAPTVVHYSIAMQALEAGKHVFIEKPITSTLKQAEELVKTAERNTLLIQVGHIERFNPALLALNGIDLHPRFIEAHRLISFVPRGLANPVIHENMIHDIDIILSLVRSPVSEIVANGVAVVSEHADIANARLTFENGCVANVTASRVSLHPTRKMRIFQPETYITIDFQNASTEMYRLVDADEPQGGDQVIPLEGSSRKIVYANLELPQGDAMVAEQTAFAEAIRSGSRPVIDGRDGLEALRIADTINQQLRP